jgi:nucleotide-binding universal stress UspA family protein
VERILIPVGEKTKTERALEVGSAMAKELGADIRLVHVIDPRQASAPEGGVSREVVLADIREAGQEILNAARMRLPAHVAVDTALVEGKPANAITDAARQWGADMIVIGTHGRTGLRRLLLGSVAETVMRQAPCPVVTVRTDGRLGSPALPSQTGTPSRDVSLVG